MGSKGRPVETLGGSPSAGAQSWILKKAPFAYLPYGDEAFGLFQGERPVQGGGSPGGKLHLEKGPRTVSARAVVKLASQHVIRWTSGETPAITAFGI